MQKTHYLYPHVVIVVVLTLRIYFVTCIVCVAEEFRLTNYYLWPYPVLRLIKLSCNQSKDKREITE